MPNHFLTISKGKYLSAAFNKDSNKMSCLQEIVSVPGSNRRYCINQPLCCVYAFSKFKQYKGRSLWNPSLYLGGPLQILYVI